jgi:serine/threonine-protein kinase
MTLEPEGKPMDEPRVAHLADLFDQALDVPRHHREAFITQLCAGDEEILQELRSLLEAHDSSTGFFEELAQAAVSPGYEAVLAHSSRKQSETLISELESALQGRYRIESELAAGMSRVFLAEEIQLGRKVVIKVLSGDMPAGMSAERFRQEIQTAAGLQHSHIVPLLTTDSSDRLLYYTMPFVAGESLRSRIARDGSLPVRDAVSIWHDVLDALAYAHDRGIVHCDIKPGNILLSGRNALVTDFGIARAFEAAAGDTEVTTPGLAIGTPAYMAPEQVAAKVASDNRADIYAAGLVMYEMLEGRLPFSGTSTREILHARLNSKPTPMRRKDVPEDLAAMVLSCLATDRADRPASADELLSALDALAIEPRRGTQGFRRRIMGYSAAAVVVVASVLGVMLLKDRPARVASPGVSIPSIAILPVTNLSRDSADAALADGMTEELRGMLSGAGNLRVIGSTSVTALHDRHLTSRQIADSLGVTHFLEGSLQKVGSRVRMRFRLVDAADGSTRWSDTYDREIADVFEVQDNISRAVVSELDGQLNGAGPAARNRRLTSNIAAYEWYLRGTSLPSRNGNAERQQTIAYLNKAIAADSNFAAAYARLTWEYLNAGGSRPGDYRQWNDLAERAALKAVQLDDSLAEAHSALGWALYAKENWPGAEAELKRAVAIDPGVHRGEEGLSRVYMMMQRPAEQLAAAQRGLAVDPYSVQAMREMALALNMNDRCDETIRLLKPLESLTPPAAVAGVIVGQCYIRKQMWSDAIAEFRWAMKTGDARTALAFLGYSLARAGQTAEAQTILDDLLAGRKNSHGAFGIAVVYTGFRDYDHAFEWLHKAIQERSLRVYIMDPIFSDLHRDPRFREVESSGGA